MPNVFAGDPVNCSISLVGSKYESATKAEFVFYKKEDSSEVGRETAELSGGQGTCAWTAPEIDDEAKLSMEVYYSVEFEVDGAQECAEGFGEDITIWVRQVKILAKDPDGKAMKDAKLEVYQGDECNEGGSTVRKTDSQGTFTYDLREPANVLVQFLAPYNVLEWTKGAEDTGQQRECKVEKKPYKANIWSHPASNSDVKHYVNLAENGDEPHHGHVLKLRIGGEGDKGKNLGQTAQVGDEIHYQIKLSEYKRSDPAIAVKVNGVTKAATGTREWKDKVALLAKEGDVYKPVEIDVELGYEGGIEVEIKVGATPDLSDQTLKIVTWRQIYYELQMPQCMTPALNNAGTHADGTSGYDFAESLRNKVTERLASAFVEYLCHKAHVFRDNQASPATIISAAYFGEEGRAKHVLASNLVEPDPKAFDGGKGNLALKMRLCDKAFSSQGVNTSENTVDVRSTSHQVACTTDGEACFEYSMDTGNRGTVDVSGCVWKAKVANKENYRQENGTYNHPGLNANGTEKSGPMQAGWIEYKDWKNVTVKLPPTSDPGKFVGGDSATNCPVTVEFNIEQTYAINGSAGGGRQLLVLRPASQAGANSSTICHELAHAMGMGLMPGRSKKPPGTDDFKHIDEGGNYYRKGTPVDGTNGLRGSHVGAHCAEGVANKLHVHLRDGTCILFGAGGSDDSRPNFCDTCRDYLKARRLTNIVSRWDNRADDQY